MIGFNESSVVEGAPRMGISLPYKIEDRFREICAANGMTLTQGVKEAMRCWVAFYDKPLEPKP